MAITDGSAVGFSNSRLRKSADRLSGLHADLALIIDEWFTGGMSGLIPNNAGELFVDGAPDDGRIVVTGADATTLVNTLISVKAALDAGGVMANINKYAVNPRSDQINP